MADINILYAQRDSITRQLETVRFRIQATEQNLQRREQELAQLQPNQTADRELQQVQIRVVQRTLQGLREDAARLEAELAQVNREISVAQQVAAAPRQSAGDIVLESQRARDEGASVTNPPRPALRIDIDGVGQPVVNDDVEPTNADRTPTSTAPGSSAQDSGLDDPTRRQSQTQSTPATLPAPGPVQPSASGPQAGANVGAAAAGDDVRASVNAIFSGDNLKIITQANPLDRYASYTYSISIYLMSPQDFARLTRSKNKNLAGYNLLIQSAGIPVSTGFGSTPGVADVGEVPGVTTFSQDAGRNEYFQEDFYIEDLELTSLISGKGTAGPHNVTTLQFRIVEPNGISLLPRLHKAVQQYAAGQGGVTAQNYAAQNFLMVIRFYGYDVAGNQYLPIKGTRNDAEGKAVTTPTTIEKFIPFQFKSIKFRVADKLTEYSCEAVCPQNLIATGPARGQIPYNVEITSKTLQELFNGPLVFSSGSRSGTVADVGEVPGVTVGNRSANEPGAAPGVTVTNGTASTTNTAPAKASAASTPTITQGLAQALNQFQDDLVSRGVYTVPDRYSITILTPALQNARVVPPGQTNQRTVPMGPGPTGPANQQKNPATQSQNKDARSTSALAGMSIMQFIDQYARTSTYIYDQQNDIRDSNTQAALKNATPSEVTAWYRVGIQTVPRQSDGYDPKRNDYAYDITYQLSPYKVNDLQSDYFPKPKFQGTHKKYNYWFTGENTQILKFEQDFNYIYYLTVNSQQTLDQATQTTDYREYLKKAFSPRSAQSTMGTQGTTNEPSANAADYLYSPADQGQVSLQILGDPSWLQQGELWAGVAGAGQLYGPFLDDGTINYEGQEVLFEIAFNQPVDYNFDTGVMDPTTKNFDKTDSSAGSARQSYVYKATKVTSRFNKGEFTQQLDGVLILFDLPQQNRAQTESEQRDVSALPNESAAETRRLQASADRVTASPSFAQRQAQAAVTVGDARRAQYGELISDPLNALFGQGRNSTVATPALPATAPTSSGQAVGTVNDPGEVPGVTVTNQAPQQIAREP